MIMDPKDKEFLTNLAQMKGGKMVIELPQSLQKSLHGETEIALNTMTEEQTKLLLDQRKAFENVSMKDIAQQQVSLVENIDRDLSYIAAMVRKEAGEAGTALAKQLGFDPLTMAIEANKMVDKLATSAGGAVGNLITEPKSGVISNPKITAEAKAKNVTNVPTYLKNEEEKKKEKHESTATQHIIVTHKSGDVIMDHITRALNMKEVLNHPDQYTGRNRGGKYAEGE
jgi:hypothetical protein